MIAVEHFIISWVYELNGKTIGALDDLFIIGGIDSLNFVELVSNLEDKFNIVVDFSNLLDWNSVKTAHGISVFLDIK